MFDPESKAIDTAFGSGVAGNAGDGGPAADAKLYRPAAVTFHGGYAYISDTYNHVIRRVRM